MDAGLLYAYVDADDRHHAVCVELLETHPGPLIVPHLVITEVVYFIGTRLDTRAEVEFLGDLARVASRSSLSGRATGSGSPSWCGRIAICRSGQLVRPSSQRQSG